MKRNGNHEVAIFFLMFVALLALLTFPSTVEAQTRTNITSLNDINDPTGDYLITGDIDASGFMGIASFSGTLAAGINPDTKMPYRITNLSAPLFTTLTGTVKNLLIDNVTITSGDASGNTGAIACTANGAARIYNVGILGGSVGGSNDVGGLVGFLNGTARVVNCYSYADITSGDSIGGIVGYNKVATASNNLKTMVFGCMFYGGIDTTNCPHRAPVYNGIIISNKDSKGVSNFNYFRLEAPYVQPKGITYNCALGAEDRFLRRFEFYRHLLNSHREVAAWWVTGSSSDTSQIMKWVLLPDSIGTAHPYPILKKWGKYPSVVNIDAANAESFSSDPETRKAQRNQGRKFGTLTVNIQMGSGGAVFGPPTGAAITKADTTLVITDKDPDHFNFNYYKVQLPYYNDVGTKNYNGNRVVTGWKIVGITGGTAGNFTTGTDAPAYNFADRNCTNKDLYSVSGRVFSQGAYWDVPEGVTAITIEPYWAQAAYVSDAYPDMVYNTGMGTSYNVSNVGGGQKYTNGNSYNIAGENQRVFTSISNAVTNANGLNSPTSNTVNDYAVVLVGNVHQYTGKNGAIGSSYRYTVTTIDLNGDNEPDYSYMLRDDGRNSIHPLKWDFLNVVGLGMAQKSYDGSGSFNLGILCPYGWFEVTNTALFRVTQLEYESSTHTATDAHIVQGGVIEQWVSSNQKGTSNKIPYIHVGGNVWFKEFHTGCHQDKDISTLHSPISVTGGDYDEFYLTGLYVSCKNSKEDNAECYINGGRFGIVCGAAMEGIGKANGNNNTGNITWIIQNADIKEFYAGALNAAKPATGSLSTTITGGYIGTYCGGPKFGDMSASKTVTTTATGCTFGTFFGAGYGGNSYSRQAPRNHNNIVNFPHDDKEAGNDASWNAWLGRFYTQEYSATYGGVSTQFNYQFLPMSSNVDNVARIFVEYVKFSLATTRSVTSNLTECTVTGNFYGGGSLGKVEGTVTSVLDSCMVNGNVFGAGFSASLPPVEVDSINGFRIEPYYYEALGTYRTGVKRETTTYTWRDTTVTVNNTATAINKDKHLLFTNENLKTLGTVTSNVTLTLQGNTTVGTLEGGILKAGTGNVYGGGDESAVNGNTTVILEEGTHVHGNVYGGGNEGRVGGNSEVKIQNQSE